MSSLKLCRFDIHFSFQRELQKIGKKLQYKHLLLVKGHVEVRLSKNGWQNAKKKILHVPLCVDLGAFELNPKSTTEDEVGVGVHAHVCVSVCVRAYAKTSIAANSRPSPPSPQSSPRGL